MASRRVSKAFDYVQYGLSVGLFGSFIAGIGFMYMVHKERMDIATEYEKKIMAYREKVQTVAAAANLDDDGTDRVRAASADVARANGSSSSRGGNSLQAASPLESRAGWAWVWQASQALRRT